MRKSLLLGISILLFSCFSAQEGYWSKTKIGFVIAPKFNTGKIINESSSTSYSFADKGSFNFGAHMITKLNKTFALNYGLTATWNALERKDKCETCDNVDAKTNNLKYRYLTIPLLVQVYFQNERIDIFGIAGMNYNLLTKSFGDYSSASGTQYDLISLREQSAISLFGLEIGAGVDYNLTYRASLRMNITYQYYLNNFSSTPAASISALNFQPGIFYQF